MTAQINEILILSGKKYSMCSCPLQLYLNLSKIPKKICCSKTSLWRGYVGTWEIIDERLYLIELQGNFVDGSFVNLEALFPGYPDRVFAHWYSGLLRIPLGQMLKYEHMGFGSIYESNLRIRIEKGVIIDKYEIANNA